MIPLMIIYQNTTAYDDLAERMCGVYPLASG